MRSGEFKDEGVVASCSEDTADRLGIQSRFNSTGQNLCHGCGTYIEEELIDKFRELPVSTLIPKAGGSMKNTSSTMRKTDGPNRRSKRIALVFLLA